MRIRAPQWLYDVRHPLLEPKWRGTERWYHRAVRAVVEWVIDLFEWWECRPAMKRMQEQADALDAMAKATDRVVKAFESSPLPGEEGQGAK
jgi:hypothetical protein